MTFLSEPSVSVSNLTATANYFDVPNLVRIHWNHIPHEAWSGNVGGYLVSLCLLRGPPQGIGPPPILIMFAAIVFINDYRIAGNFRSVKFSLSGLESIFSWYNFCCSYTLSTLS